MNNYNEERITVFLNAMGFNFRLASNKYSVFDAIDKKKEIIIEYKHRNKFYDEVIHKFDKHNSNKAYIDDHPGYRFLYCVSMPVDDGEMTYIFEPLKLNLIWFDVMIPATTYFENKEKRLTKCCYLPLCEAIFSFKSK